MLRSPRLSPLAFAAGTVLLAALPALAVQAPAPEPLHSAVVAPAGFVATPAPQPLSAVASELDPLTAAAYGAFAAEYGSGWRFYVDRRSGAAALAEGPGVEWVTSPGIGLAALEARARDLVRRYPGLFGATDSQLELDPAASGNFGEDGQFWSLTFRQQIAGVPVDSSAVVFRVSHGNLVQFGMNRVLPQSAALAAVTPAVSAAAAKAAVGAHVGGLLAGDLFVEDGDLLWIARGTADEVGYTGAVGSGWTPHLAYRYTFLRSGSAASWTALVDALSGEVLRFTDANDYVSVLKASVYPSTNCSDPTNCVSGSATEVPVTMPDANLTFSDGSTGFTNSAGGFDYPPLAVAATSDLSGRYFTLVDGCGAITVTSQGVQGDLDAGTTRNIPPGPANTDCAPADSESDPGTLPLTGGPGDTHAARSAYYHLNLINQKSRFYLPANDWLKGVDGSLGPSNLLTNVAPVCNAFWQGGTQSLAFFKQTPGLQCNNTGEIAGVFLHEFGHGLDAHDGTGTAPESATGEAMGDTFSLLQTQQSCVGPGFRLPDPLDPEWGNTAGYGSKSRLCSGVRDMDYTRYCRQGTGGCGPVADPDEVNGSRSGTSPPAEPAGELGTPAAWFHMMHTGITPGAADGMSNFYDCGGPETTGCAGPLNHGCHCESLIPSQANWDLAKGLIASDFGGSAYADPQGPTEVSGWQYMDRLWYLTRDLAISGYSVTGPFPSGMTNGCTATDWFSTYRFVDDDDGDLANGTPHADLIFDAFDRHAIACGAASDPSNQAGGCPAPVAAPTLGAVCGTAPVELTWTPSAGAESYRVLRNTLGCGFGFTPLAEVGGSRDFFEDSEVAPGVTYYYTVQPVGAPSCYGFASNCLEITPTECTDPALPAPGNVTLDNSTDNEIGVTWDAVAGAGSYKILRRSGGCSSGEPEEAVGLVPAPSTSFTDGDDVVGGLTYGYRVAASDASCASCVGAASACVEIQANGECNLDPLFAGVGSVSSATSGTCSLNVGWDAGSAQCGSALTYTVFRSTDPAFLPTGASQVASGISGTSYTDFQVAAGTRYYYIVRADDAFGNQDGNTVRRYEVPVGALTPGSFADDAGDTSGEFIASPPPSSWAVRTDDAAGGNASQVYATSAAGNYPDNTCNGLESPTLRLGGSPTLSFATRYDIEQGWDGGIVQVATEASGFSDWTRLDTVGYPGVMSGPLGDPACGLAEFNDLEPVFTGTSVGYESYNASLGAYAGQTVRVRFLFASDAATNQAGWFIDDVGVDQVSVGGACTARPNADPTPQDDEATTEEDTPVTIDVLANDSDPDGDPLTVTAVTQPANGSVTNDGGGEVTYTPAPGFSGEDTFTYTVEDGLGGSATATVTVTVVEDVDPGTCREIDDSDPAVEYRTGWHRRNDAQASNGGYHRRKGTRTNGNGTIPYARVVFEGDSVTLFYLESNRGGSADVFIDGGYVETLSFGAGGQGKEVLSYGHQRTYDGLGSGSHEFVVEHVTDSVYIDGFGFDCAEPAAGPDPAAAEYGSETEVSTATAAEGPIVTRTVEVGPDDQDVSVVLEGSSLPLTVELLDPVGALLASGSQLVAGDPATGLDADVSAPGTYTVRVLTVPGSLEEIEISVARTVWRP